MLVAVAVYTARACRKTKQFSDQKPLQGYAKLTVVRSADLLVLSKI